MKEVKSQGGLRDELGNLARKEEIHGEVKDLERWEKGLEYETPITC